jgi:multiple RNA-binding domain-containing protein 1
VEKAKRAGDPTIVSLKEKYSEAERERQNKEKEIAQAKKREKQKAAKEHKDKKMEEEQHNPRFLEFLNVVQKKSKFWANDENQVQEKKKVDGLGVVQKSKVPAAKRGGESVIYTRTHMKFDNERDEGEEVQDNHNDDNNASASASAVAAVEKDVFYSDEESDDDDYQDMPGLKSAADHSVDDEQEEEQPVLEEKEIHLEDENDESEEQQTRLDGMEASQEASGAEVEDSGVEEESPTGRLFVRNLPFDVTADELRAKFAKYGTCEEVHVVLDKSGLNKGGTGMAYITYALPESAIRAINALDGASFMGRLIHILHARERRVAPAASGSNQSNTGGSLHLSAYQRAKEQKLKASAGERSGLYLRSDTAVQQVASKLGVDKRELLSSENAAVNVAVMETFAIGATQSWLLKAGVNVDALGGSGKSGGDGGTTKSETVLLIKNLSGLVETRELRELLSRFGPLLRLVHPPASPIALVEYAEGNHAKAAFRHCAYTRLRDAPLFLEFAPANTFARPANASDSLPEGEGEEEEEDDKKKESSTFRTAEQKRRELSKHLKDGGAEDPEGTEFAGSHGTVFVKNLNFTSTEKEILKHFQDARLVDCLRFTLAKKTAPNNATTMTPQGRKPRQMSKGYGFLSVKSEDDAVRLVRRMQGTELHEHKLVLEVSKTKTSAPSQSSRQAGGDSESAEASSKLMVRNVPFEATRKDIQLLFSQFANVKTVRMPKKFDGTHRGFAFVEFLTEDEAERARKVLENSHLYGRHLVIEPAQGAQSLQELRKRSSAQLDEAQAGEKRQAKKKRSTVGTDKDEFA